MVSRIREFIKRIVIQAIVVLMISFMIGYVLTGFNLHITIANLDILTLIISLIAILGKILGALYPVYGIARASIIAPSVAEYSHDAVKQAADNPISSWLILFASIALAYVLSLVLKDILAPMFEDAITYSLILLG